MTDSKAVESGNEEPRLRLDIHLNFEGLSEVEGSIAWLTRFAGNSGDPGDKLVELAGKIYQSRRLRDRYVDADLLGEPAWDMLLAIYCFMGKGQMLSISGVCHSSAVPHTTALRWLDTMEQRNLVKRSRDHKDGRRFWLSMTDEGKKLMDEYLTLLQSRLK